MTLRTRRIFLIWIHPLFYESVRLLLDHPQIQLVGSVAGHLDASEQIQKLQPDIVLVEENTEEELSELANMLRSCPPQVQLVGLNISDNRLNIYHREQQLIGRPEELLGLLLQETL